MSALAKTAMTLADFLAWEEHQPERHEFIDGEIFAMVGARVLHQILALNLSTTLKNKLRGTGCIVLPDGTKLQFDDNIYYPDALVTCDRTERRNSRIEHPTLIAEVLSPSTEDYDRGKKWKLYRDGLPSLQAFLLISQEEVLVELYRRNKDGWQLSTHRDLTDEISLTHPPCSFTVADIYDDTLDLLGDQPADATS